TYDVQSSVSSNRAPSVRTVEVEAYPGVNAPDIQRRQIDLKGQSQEVTRPPGSTPSAISGIPGFNQAADSAQLSERLTLDPPGQAATFLSTPVNEQLLMAGTSTVQLQIAATEEQPSDEAVLFAKLYDIGPDGTSTLPGNAVAPFRVPSLPA